MNIIDPKHLLSNDEKRALLYYLSRPFQIGTYASLLNMAEALKIEVTIKDGMEKATAPDELFDARCYWEGRAAQLLPQLKPHERAQTSVKKRFYLEAINQVRKITDEMLLWAELPLMGFYDLSQNCIVIYPETMRNEDRKRTLRAIVPCPTHCDDVMKNATYRNSFTEILLTTLVRSLWHAYFCKSEHAEQQHYYPLIEAPLTEYALLLYLKQTGIPFIHWAYEDVKRMPTCHRYGITIMHQYVSPESRERIISFIKAYHKIMSNAQPSLIYDVYAGCNLKELVE